MPNADSRIPSFVILFFAEISDHTTAGPYLVAATLMSPHLNVNSLSKWVHASFSAENEAI